MRGKLKTAGKGYQPAEVLLVQKRDGKLRIDDCGGWSKRCASSHRDRLVETVSSVCGTSRLALEIA